MPANPKKPQSYTDALISETLERISAGGTVRRDLPGGGRLYVDRQMPFLCLYRRPVDHWDGGAEKLVTSAAVHMVGSDDRRLHSGQAALVRKIVEVLQERFGAFLLLEFWTAVAGAPALESAADARSVARVFHVRSEESDRFAEVLRQSLASDRRVQDLWRVEVTTAARRRPERPPPILRASEARDLGCTRLGLELPPIFRDDESRELYPVVLRAVRRVVDVALRKAVFEFSRERATRTPMDYRALGRKAVAREVWRVDAQLADLARSYDFLLAMTPTNAERCWRAFRKARFERAPDLRYRPLTVDVSQAKRSLFSVPLERVEDPAMADLLREKQLELDRQLTILAERGSRRVLYGGLQLYGAVEDALLREAEAVIELIGPGAKEGGDGKRVTAAAFAALAEQQIARYAERVDTEGIGVELRQDLASGLMVSRGRLLINAAARFPRARMEALLQHEVGTHVLTFLNGRSQRFQQLAVGLADYDGTQEGLAVLSEYLVGGLSKPRLRVLAGRVVAARALTEGATFVEAFRLLLRYGFSQLVAYQISVRTFRGGGLTKDAVYLRGLGQVLDYLATGGPLGPLYVGKLALHHLGIIRELTARGILTPAPLLPSFLDDPAVVVRLERLRAGRRPHQLVEPWDS